MKTYYISSGLQGCYMVRCLMPLHANGWDGDQTSIRLETREPVEKTKAADAADVVVFHRPDSPDKLQLARLLKLKGKKIVYDNDDTFKDDGGFKFNEYMNEERMKKGLARINDIIDAFIKEADVVTCSTEFLAEEYRAINPNVHVVPNCVDPFYFDEPLKNEGDVVRIGITGSIGVTSDFDIGAQIVHRLQDRKDIRFVLFSLPPAKRDKLTRELYSEEYKTLETLDVEWQSFVDHQDYYETLNNLRLDLMIIPRADNYFNRCKSNLKFLEASMFEIPCICQSFPDGKSPYEVNEKDKDHLILATTVDNWVEKIVEMVENKKKRIALGKKAKKYVLKNYNIEDNAHRWVTAYKS